MIVKMNYATNAQLLGDLQNARRHEPLAPMINDLATVLPIW